MLYFEYLNVFEAVVNELNSQDAQHIKDCQEVLQPPTFRMDIQFITTNLCFLPLLMHQMEEADVGLERGLVLLKEAEEKVSKIPGKRENILQQKFAAISKRNSGLQQAKAVRDKLRETCCLTDMHDYKSLARVPVHGAYI